MPLTFYGYPKCGTCQKAKKWLDEHDIDYTDIHIADNTPTKEQLLKLITNSQLPPKKFFNTSGKKYRENNMKDKMKDATTEDMAEWLASDGMLIKRPVITDGQKVTVGFDDNTFASTWL